MAFDIFIFHSCRQRVYLSLLAFCCCVINYHKLGSFGTMRDYLRVLQVRILGHRVSQGWNQGLRGLNSYLGRNLLPSSWQLLVEFGSSWWWMAGLDFFAGSPPGATLSFWKQPSSLVMWPLPSSKPTMENCLCAKTLLHSNLPHREEPHLS